MALTAGAEDRPEALAPADVRRMFDTIVPRYDLLNHLLSMGLDVLWRRCAARQACLDNPRVVVDLCCGTGDLSAAVARRLAVAEREAAAVVGIDFSAAMVARANSKHGGHRGLRFVVGDALAAPMPEASADSVTCAFGLRNVAGTQAFVDEVRRLLRPGGRLVVVEFFRPEPGLWRKFFGFYFRRVVPIVGGWISGHRWAYRYLPASASRFLSAEEFVGQLTNRDFRKVAVRRLAGGAATMVSGVKAAADQGVPE